MAIAGSVTQAYRCWLEGTRLSMIPTSTLRSLCEEPETAVRMIQRGMVATVAGADVDTVRQAVTRQEVTSE